MPYPRIASARLAALMFGASLAVAGSAQAKTDAEKAQEQVAKDRQTFQSAYDALVQGDCRTVIGTLNRRLGQKPPVDPPSLAAAGYEMISDCYSEGDDFRKAAEMAIEGTQFSGSSDRLWVRRLYYQLRLDDARAAVATVEAMTNGRGNALNRVPIENLYALTRGLKTKGLDDERRRLLAILAAPSYAPAGPIDNPDGFRSSYATLLVEDGKNDEAAIVLGDIRSSEILIEMMLDPRFKALLPAELDPRALVEADLAKAVTQSKLNATLLTPLVDASRYLRRLGRPEEALAMLEVARERPGGLEGHSDAPGYLNWWWDSLARTYAMLGRYEEMVHAFDSGARVDEDGMANVSQVINLAWAQIDFGRPEAALETFESFSLTDRDMSDYGTMQMRFARGCALAQAGRRDEAAEDLEFMRAHPEDDPFALAEMLVCVGDSDAGARVYIDQLSNPDKRATALLKLSAFNSPLPSQPNGAVLLAFMALIDRADVKEAAARAGGTRRFDLQRGEAW